MFFVGDSSREKDSGRLREKIPQAIKLERCAIEAHERLDKIAVDRIVIINEAVPEIADPKVAFYESKSPAIPNLAQIASAERRPTSEFREDALVGRDSVEPQRICLIRG